MNKIDQYGIVHYTTDEICDLLYKSPSLSFDQLVVDDPDKFNKSVRALYVEYPILKRYSKLDVPLEEFDAANQAVWYMPEEYINMDIAKFVLDQCKNDAELQRAGQELLMFQERDMFHILCFMKYFVDTMRKHKKVWGVGRGSSVSSFVLYLIGIHKVNSLYYDLPIEEFLK